MKTNYNFYYFSVLGTMCVELHGLDHTKSTSTLLVFVMEHIKCCFLPFLNKKTALSDSKTEAEESSMYRCR